MSMYFFVLKLRVYLAAIVLRLFAFAFCSSYLGRRPELVTPLNSYRQLLDGIRLHRDGVLPYAGQLFHYPPIVIVAFEKLVDNKALVFAVFVLLDILTAEILRRAAGHFHRAVLLRASCKEVPDNHGRSARVTREARIVDDCDKPQTADALAALVVKCYLLNPITVATCAALSMSVVHNFLTALVACALFAGREVIAAGILAVATQLTLYPVVLLPALVLRGRHWAALVFATVFAVIFALNWQLESSGQFLAATYGFIVAVPDLRPNVGIFWYFFIQVFDHFRRFFLWVFQLNVLVYVVPLTVTLRRDPQLLFQLLLIILSVFSSYPSLSDSCIYLALLPLFSYLNQYIRHGLVIGCTLVVCVALAPVMWQMWIVFGSGNANFYFAVTLAYCVAQVFLVTDLLYAQLRRQVAELYGAKVDSKDAVGFILQ